MLFLFLVETVFNRRLFVRGRRRRGAVHLFVRVRRYGVLRVLLLDQRLRGALLPVAQAIAVGAQDRVGVPQLVKPEWVPIRIGIGNVRSVTWHGHEGFL